MIVQSIRGFPLSDDYAVTRVPNAVLGRVLADVKNADIIKLILRTIWLLERQNGYPRSISLEHLKSDRVLSVVFNDPETLETTLDDTVKTGVLVRVSINGTKRLMLNTESARQVSLGSSMFGLTQDKKDSDDGWDAPAVARIPANAFRAYEENIGVLSPMTRESILTALEDFTDDDITQAIRIAVENESRSWSFVAGVLRRWARDGIPYERADGTAGGDTGHGRIPQAELRKYLEEQRRRTDSK